MRRAGAGQDHADEPRDLQAADGGQDPEGVTGVRAVHGERLPDRLDLPYPHVFGHSRPAPRGHGRIGAGERRRERARGGRVADAHLTRPDAVRRFSVHEGRARRDRPDGLVASHRGALGDAAGPRRHGTVDDRRVIGQGRSNAEIRHHDPGADVPGKHVHPGAAPREVLDHLRGDCLGVGAHPLGGNAVVAGEREDHRGVDPRHRIARDHDNPDRQLLQPTQTPSRLRQAVEPSPSRHSQALVGRRDRGDKPFERRHSRRPPPAKPRESGAFTVSGQPATMSTTSPAAPATAWLTRPSASRNLRPSSVCG